MSDEKVAAAVGGESDEALPWIVCPRMAGGALLLLESEFCFFSTDQATLVDTSDAEMDPDRC
jgi:hypothetical protein